MNNPRVENMQGRSGPVANQFKVFSEDGVYFQSYSTIIAFKPYGEGKIKLNKTAWDYSRTTGKYRNQFLRETKAETEKKIKSGEYEMVEF
jgi:hypothetical protein